MSGIVLLLWLSGRRQIFPKMLNSDVSYDFSKVVCLLDMRWNVQCKCLYSFIICKMRLTYSTHAVNSDACHHNTAASKTSWLPQLTPQFNMLRLFRWLTDIMSPLPGFFWGGVGGLQGWSGRLRGSGAQLDSNDFCLAPTGQMGSNTSLEHRR